MVPFMNTSIIVGPAATALDGADLAFYVGFIVAGILYYALLKVASPAQPAREVPAGVGTAADDAAR
jgi:NCS1 family nucleobase:cation symporter-1